MAQPQQINLDAILAKFPNLLQPAEQQLPTEQRNAILRQRVQIMLQKQQQNRKAQANLATQQQQAQQQQRVQQAAQAQQLGGAQHIRPNAQAGSSQSPRIMQQGMKGQPVQMNPNVSCSGALLTASWRRSCSSNSSSSSFRTCSRSSG